MKCTRESTWLGMCNILQRLPIRFNAMAFNTFSGRASINICGSDAGCAIAIPVTRSRTCRVKWSQASALHTAHDMMRMPAMNERSPTAIRRIYEIRNNISYWFKWVLMLSAFLSQMVISQRLPMRRVDYNKFWRVFSAFIPHLGSNNALS